MFKTLPVQESARGGLATREETAKFLSCSIETIKRLQRAGKLKAVPLAERMIRYRWSDIEALIAAPSGKKGAAK